MDPVQKQIITLLKTKKEDITINQIADELGIERHTASRHLESLKGLGICTFRSIGKSKVWKLAPSAFLSIMSEESPLRDELDMFLSLVDNKITVQTQNHDIIWANKGKINKKCYELHGKKEHECDCCPVEKTFATGKTQKSTCQHNDIVTKPIKDKDGKTIAVINILKNKD
ncbi:winged helix-turn-helix transcriptional regulator [Candidatus Woesearchaeota archaeon]|nr:winged helix-turn-helix transcriptional regulator [Candidatus Woesearchaeota archaeon]